MKLAHDQYLRYGRQLILPEIHWEGQQKLLQGKVLLVGMGGLGSPQALYLAAAGVGTLGIADGDRVDLTNLQRQVIHSTEDLGMLKVDSARRKIEALNPEVNVIQHPDALSSRNAMEILSGYDIVVDCTDNFPARYLLNDGCVLLKKPLVHGAIHRFGGQATVLYPAAEGPCYRCLFPVPPPPGAVPSCAEAGVLGVVPGVVGLIQASEVLKLLIGKGQPLIGRLLICDIMAMSFEEVALRRDPECPVCGDNPSVHELIDYDAFCGLHERIQSTGEGISCDVRNITAPELQKKMQSGERISFLDVREEWEHALYPSFRQAISLPYSKLASQWESLLPLRDREVVVCCLFGYRSREACRFLAARGFDTLWNLQGGLEEWSLNEAQSSGEA